MPDRSPSKPLTPTELDELRRSIPGHPRESLDAGAWYSPETVARLLVTLDATQAVEPEQDALLFGEWLRRAAAQAWQDYRMAQTGTEKEAFHEGQGNAYDAAIAKLGALAARSSSAPTAPALDVDTMLAALYLTKPKDQTRALWRRLRAETVIRRYIAALSPTTDTPK